MDRSYEKYEEFVKELKNSYTEEDIINVITKIVKKFSTELWREMIFSNPYFKSLFEDIQSTILGDLDGIRNSILKEIDSIDKEIRGGNVDVHKFIQLKVECQLLLMEVDYKIEELKSI
jgi:hypothetical protein